jgi:hypothetical protein
MHSQHARVVGRIGDHGHEGVVLGRRAQHGGAADIDVLDGVLKRDAGFATVASNGIEVHAHQVDGRQPVLFHDRLVLRVAAQVEQARVHLWVQGLDPPVQHLREAGELDTSVTFSPAAFSALAVPPVESSSTPSPASPRANSTNPALSETLNNARCIFIRFFTADGR